MTKAIDFFFVCIFGMIAVASLIVGISYNRCDLIAISIGSTIVAIAKYIDSKQNVNI